MYPFPTDFDVRQFQFTELAGDLELGATAVYRVVWVGNIMLSHFVSNAARQPLADRDFISFSIQRTF
jgi:hypothetical protein